MMSSSSSSSSLAYKDNDAQYQVEDTSSLLAQMQKSWVEITKSMTKPNVLLTGMTGSGKSSIINRVFGTHLAKTGTGVPITQSFQKFTHPDRPVVLFDAKGLEHGNHVAFVENMRVFFEEQSRLSSIHAIHVVWYVINAANARLQPFEEDLLRDVFREIPIVVILNKADIASVETRNNLRTLIQGIGIKHLLGVFDVSAAPKESIGQTTMDFCPACKSDNITMKIKQQVIKCESCGLETPVRGGVGTSAGGGAAAKDGLNEVVDATVEALPDFTKDAFISAQFVNFSLKEKRSQEIIRDYYNSAKSIRMTGTLMTAVSDMLARLSFLWDFREDGPSYYQHATKQLLGDLTFKDKLSLLLTKKKTFMLETTSMGILWTRCLQKLASTVLSVFVSEDKTPAEMEKEWEVMLEQSFRDLNEDNLDQILNTLDSKGLEEALAHEKLLLVEECNRLMQK